MSRCVHNFLPNYQMVPKVYAFSRSYLDLFEYFVFHYYAHTVTRWSLRMIIGLRRNLSNTFVPTHLNGPTCARGKGQMYLVNFSWPDNQTHFDEGNKHGWTTRQRRYVARVIYLELEISWVWLLSVYDIYGHWWIPNHWRNKRVFLWRQDIYFK